jgi:hypothetical protein
MHRPLLSACQPSWSEFALWCLPAAMVLAVLGAGQLVPSVRPQAADLSGYFAPANERWVAKGAPVKVDLAAHVRELPPGAYLAARVLNPPGGE